MPRGKKIAITLTEEEQRTLNMWAAAGKTEQRYVQRAKAILFSAEGHPLSEVSKKSGLSRQNCTRWRMRFLKERIDGLKDLPRKGRPSVISPEVKTKVTMLACTKLSDGSNQWTRQSLAKAVGLGKTTVHRILSEGSVKPHKKEP
jgi:putative transposase